MLKYLSISLPMSPSISPYVLSLDIHVDIDIFTLIVCVPGIVCNVTISGQLKQILGRRF